MHVLASDPTIGTLEFSIIADIGRNAVFTA